jgi:hypothetical protein
VGQALPEIPLPVEERDSDQRQPKIAGGFGMVARKNAETTGVNWQSGVDAKLGGKNRRRIGPSAQGDARPAR